MNKIHDNYINALKAKYDAQRLEALANFALYTSGTNLAAIGEHSDIIEEQDKWISVYADATDKLSALEEMMTK